MDGAALSRGRLRSQPGILDLEGHVPLRTSRNYGIYQHPDFERLLVKVRTDPRPEHRLPRRYSEWRYGALRQWQREANEYLAALNRGVPEIARLARFSGYAMTTSGPAMLVEKMTGPNGKLAPTALEEARAQDPDGTDRRVLRDELMALVDDLERGRIIVGDLWLENIVRAQERDGALTVIDGLGERVLLAFSVFSDRVFRAGIVRRRQRLLDAINGVR